MRISAHTYVTNPLSTGYLMYLPAIQSFLDLADEVVVVDGGSTDGSLEALKALRGSEKLKIFASEQTSWGPGDAWERPQFAIQRQTGYELCSGDWTIAFDADHVLPDFEQDALRRALEERQNQGVLYGFRIVACNEAEYRPVTKIKRWCVNRRLALAHDLPLVWGVKDETGGNERPVVRNSQRSFIDPVTGIEKRYWAGLAYPEDGTLPVRLYKYDHFFFTPAQLAAKLQRFENMRARWERRPARPMPPERQDFERVDVESWLAAHRHPRAFADFLRSWAASPAAVEVAGLRRPRAAAAPRDLRRLFDRMGARLRGYG